MVTINPTRNHYKITTPNYNYTVNLEYIRMFSRYNVVSYKLRINKFVVYIHEAYSFDNNPSHMILSYTPIKNLKQAFNFSKEKYKRFTKIQCENHIDLIELSYNHFILKYNPQDFEELTSNINNFLSCSTTS